MSFARLLPKAKNLVVSNVIQGQGMQLSVPVLTAE